jgi:hypothetical protein
MTICKNCIHEKVCKYTNEKISIGTTVGETMHECKDYTSTADVVEVKHGRWQIEDRGGKPTDRPICSQCGATPKYYLNGESSPYCQECGSKMERKVKPYVR